jgi:exopolysaccharide biosynthesis predicted pyruvyltransferase EpsI
MDNKLVSVIIPIYNVELYLKVCVNSILKQTYNNLEIILVDDGSTDRCPEICDEYYRKDSRIRVIHKSNEGVSSARNVGLETAGGEFVYFIDSDDYLEEDAIEALIKEANHHSADFVFFDARIFGEIKNFRNSADYYIRKGLYSNQLSGPEMLNELLINKEYRTPVPLLFIRKDVLIKNKLFFYEKIIYEDQLFTLNLFLSSNVTVHLAEPLYNRRVRTKSITCSKITLHNFKSVLTVASHMIDMYLAEKKSLYNRKVISYCLNRFLKGSRKIYFQLSLIDKLNVQKELKKIGDRLSKYNYLENKTLLRTNKAFNLIKMNRIYRSIKIELLNLVPQLLKIFIKIFINKLQYNEKEYFLTLCKLKSTSSKKRLLLIGTPMHGNLGDHAIALAEKDFFKKYITGIYLIEIPMPELLGIKDKMKNYINEKDVIVISGGGWLGNLWKHNEYIVRDIIEYYPNNRIIIMPQTIYFDNTLDGNKEKALSKQIYSKHPNLVLCLRDKSSYELVKDNKLIQNLGNCILMPDMAFGINKKNNNKNRDGILLCFRKDIEKKISFRDVRKIKEHLWKKGEKTAFTTTVYIKYKIDLNDREKLLDEKLDEYAKAKLIITDRLHSMIFAAIVGTPCVIFDNITGKVEGVYDWIKNLDYIKLATSVEESKKYIDILLSKKRYVYNDEFLKYYFNKLKIKILT